MLIATFAHRLLIAFGLFVVVVLVVVATQLGYFGDAARIWLDANWGKIQSIYQERQDLFDTALKSVGFIGSLLGAAWTIHRGWHYAERNLPARLNEFNARSQIATVIDRLAEIPALAEPATIATATSSRTSFLSRLISYVHDGEQLTLQKREERLNDCKERFAVLRSTKVRTRAEVVSAYLALGSQIARLYPDRGHDALDAYKKALDFNRTDFDALELSAKQSFALNLRQQALSYLEKLAEAAARGHDPIRQARALRFQAEILRGGQRAERDSAREKLVAAISLLDAADGIGLEAREYERGLANEQLAAVQITRERFYVARTALIAARNGFSNVSSASGRRGLDRLLELEDQLNRAEQDRDNPDVPD